MLKIIAAAGLSSTLILAPALALADESTTPPKADTVKTPGNGPDVKPAHHHRHHSTKHMSKKHSMKKPAPAAAPADAPTDAPK
jgi:hypothetical protein